MGNKTSLPPPVGDYYDDDYDFEMSDCIVTGSGCHPLVNPKRPQESLTEDNGSGLNSSISSPPDFEALMLVQLEDSLKFFVHNLPPWPVLIGLIGCCALIVLLAVSLLCHHVKVHISLLKDLERFGYQPDDEWKSSLLYKLSVWVRDRGENGKNNKQAFLEEQADNNAGNDGTDNIKSNKNDDSGAQLFSSRFSHFLNGSNNEGSTDKQRFEADRLTASIRRQFYRYHLRKSLPNAGSNNSPVSNRRAMSTISDFVLKTITPTLILTSIDEEHEHTGFNEGECPTPDSEKDREKDAAFSEYDPDLLQRVLALDLLELHQHLREVNQNSSFLTRPEPTHSNKGNAISFDDDEGSINFEMSPIGDELKASVFQLSDDLLPLPPTRDNDSDNTFVSMNTDEDADTKGQTQSHEGTPFLSHSVTFTAGAGDATSSYYLDVPKTPTRQPPSPSRFHSNPTKPFPARPSHLPLGGNRAGQAPVTANTILTHYAKRMGDAYSSDFF